jgi:hypothetical protein
MIFNDKLILYFGHTLKKHKVNVRGMYDSFLRSNRKKYKLYKELSWDKTCELTQVLARVMFFYIVNDLETAKKLAKVKSSIYPKVPSELLKELSEAIEEEI